MEKALKSSLKESLKGDIWTNLIIITCNHITANAKVVESMNTDLYFSTM